ncbi:MAG TPA: spermidine/putrescine ABC transporter substrate-binding protein [Actinospica sp.]|nr:spermidine/putrescine ABC transporter substrate-binding protein [Actinospica sp.]
MPPSPTPSPDPDRLLEQRSILATAARAGSMRRASRTYAASAAASRRGLLRAGALGSLAAAGAGVLSACGVDPKYPVVPESISTGRDATDYSDAEKVVNFHNWGSYIDVASDTDTSDHPTLDQFHAKYGIKVNYVEDITDNNEYYAKLDPDLSAGKDTGVDLMVFSDYMIPILRYYDYIEELDLSLIPNHKNALPEILSDPIDPGRKFTLPWAYGYTTIAYNKNIVKQPVTSIKELFERPDLRGQVVLFSEMEDTVAFALLALGKNPQQFTDAEYTEALGYVSQARSSGQVRQFMGQDYISSFSQGNIGATMAYSGDVAQLGQDNLVTVNLPTDGMLAWSDNMCIPNFARHKKNAELLMNWYYNPDIAALLDDYIDYIPCVNGAEKALQDLDPEAAGSPLIVPTTKMRAGARGFMNLNVDQLNSYTTRFQQISG